MSTTEGTAEQNGTLTVEEQMLIAAHREGDIRKALQILGPTPGRAGAKESEESIAASTLLQDPKTKEFMDLFTRLEQEQPHRANQLAFIIELYSEYGVHFSSDDEHATSEEMQPKLDALIEKLDSGGYGRVGVKANLPEEPTNSDIGTLHVYVSHHHSHENEVRAWGILGQLVTACVIQPDFHEGESWDWANKVELTIGVIAAELDRWDG